MDRRFFMAASSTGALGLLAASAAQAGEGSDLPPINLVYTADNLGAQPNRKGSHLPRIEVADSTVTVTTPHGFSDEHFIVRHTLLLADGTPVGAKTFTSKDKPVSSYTLPAGYKGKIYATSFCNLHDLWLSEATI